MKCASVPSSSMSCDAVLGLIVLHADPGASSTPSKWRAPAGERLVRACLTQHAPIEFGGQCDIDGCRACRPASWPVATRWSASSASRGRKLGSTVPLEHFRGGIDVGIGVPGAQPGSHDPRHPRGIDDTLAELPPQLAPGVPAVIAAIEIAVAACGETTVSGFGRRDAHGPRRPSWGGTGSPRLGHVGARVPRSASTVPTRPGVESPKRHEHRLRIVRLDRDAAGIVATGRPHAHAPSARSCRRQCCATRRR